MILLDINDTIKKAQEFSHIAYDAILPSEYQRLTVRFSYTPKLLEDSVAAKEIVEKCFAKYAPYHIFTEQNKHTIKNLLTLSIDSPIASIGTYQNQANQQEHTITKDSASYGFLPAKLVKGQWIFTVSIHCMVTDSVDITLQVEVDDD